jgi:pyruvate dehydrogenase E2 component (dihydrolipoamide acetyltransferase)
VATTSAIDVVMPQMGVSVSEGTITKWLKQEGEPVAADESLLEISTDKVDTEVPSPGEGILQQILVQEGETVEVGTKLAVIAPEGAAAAEAPPAETPPAEEQPPVQEETPAPPAEGPAPEPATAQAAAEAEAPSSSEGETPTAETVEQTEPAAAPVEPSPPPAEQTPPPAEPAPTPAPAPVDTDGAGEKTFVSPVVARIAAEHGVDVDQVSGTGRGGRVTKKDILAFVESGGQPAAPAAPVEPSVPTPEPPPAPEPSPAPEPPPPAAAPKPPPVLAPQPAPVAEAGQPQVGESFEPVNAMRRGIAEHMRRSLDTSAHVTSAIEVDMSNVVSIRKKLKPEYEQSYGVNPTYLSFIARATVDTLREYPWINGELRGDQIVTRSYVNLGFAVELADGKGLIVPVIRNAEGLNLLGMARSISEIAARAREKKLLPDDVQGGTFTITNPGGYGTFHGTPVISQPQAAILGTYAVVKRPWVIQDDRGQDVIAIRPIMNLTLTYDHRLVDGALAGRFLRDLREKLETWDESSY